MFLPADLVNPPTWGADEWIDHQCRARTGAEIAGLGESEVLDTLTAARRMRARADALEARALARLDRLRGGSRYVADEAALELRVSRHAAADRVRRGMHLVHRMPHLLGAMERGEIEGFAAGRIAQATAMLSAEHARAVDAALANKLAAGRLGFTDPTSLLRAARRLVDKLDPHGKHTRARQARAERKVELIPGENAMATLSADLPVEVAASAYARIDGMARTLRNRGDQRNLDQLRADVYADLLLGNNPGLTPPKGAATVFLHMPIDTALTMSDQGCELAGYGPLPAAVAREIMTNKGSVWRKVLTDPESGTIRSLGRRRRRPNAAIRDIVAARDRECTTPGCHRPAQRCDFDHLRDWRKHGVTADLNGGSKCRRDHRLKDQPGWTLDFDPTTGTGTITTPAGRTHTKTHHPITEPQPRQSTKDAVRGVRRQFAKDPPSDTEPPF